MSGRLRPKTAAFVAVCLCIPWMLGAGCSEDPLGDLSLPPIPGTEGRVRYVVTLDAPAPDLAEYRALLKENPGGVAAYVEKKRAEAAAAFVEVDAAVGTVGGRVVERWWMSNQSTIEIPATGVPTIRAVAKVKSVDADKPPQ